MGLFSGGFLGSGSDESESTSTTTTNITTTTETNVHDIGLTGANAENLAAILNASAVEITQIGADLILGIGQQQNEGFNTLVGGSNQIIQQVAEQQGINQSKLISATQELLDPDGAEDKKLMYILIAGMAMLAIILTKGRIFNG